MADNKPNPLDAQLVLRVIRHYVKGVPVHELADEFNLSRSELADIIVASGVRRDMGTMPLTADDVSNLFSMLLAAQGEIERLTERLRQVNDRP